MDTLTAQLQNFHPESSHDIFPLSDQALSERLKFIEEIGFGNWGSVWLCKPRLRAAKDGVVEELGEKLAVKLVHRSKTPTTAARLKSLWNEMKIVRSFESDPHPSIIPFHSFILTPSYALIIMSYLPTLVPVEVEESKAREWLRFLLSGIEFLHKRGVVHNDIKPANILLSAQNIPVLVDFGFAEKYDLDSDTAFHSNLSYGTPEYLSPERARGLPHDTRKSDVWALGVTFFEILVGRTPFEHFDGEEFRSKEDLEKYWSRTLRGKWVGTWDFSKGMEKLLQRMLAPNADLRCTATQAIADSYWQSPRKDGLASHKRASSYTSSIVFQKDTEKLLNATPSRKAKENCVQSPPGLESVDLFRDDRTASKRLNKSKSQPRVAGTKIAQPKKRVPAPPVIDLSPIKASPNNSPSYSSATAKENIMSFNRLASIASSDKKKQANTSLTGNTTRRPFGALDTRNNLPRPVSSLSKKPSGNTHGVKAIKVLGDLSRDPNISVITNESTESRGSTNVKDRVREWEREKERLREMEKLEEMERERDELYKREKEKKKREKRLKEDKENAGLDVSNEKNSKSIEKQRPVAVPDEQHDEADEDALARERKSASILQIRIPPPKASHVKVSSGEEKASSSNKKINNGYNINTNNDWEWDKENIGKSSASPMLPMFKPTSPLSQAVLNIVTDTPPPSTFARKEKETKQSIFKHSIKASIDKTMHFVQKSSTLAQQVTSGRSTPARGFSFDVSRDKINSNHDSKTSTKDGKEAWEAVDADGSFAEVSPLPIIKNAAESEQVAADARMDRMAIWMRNVEKVVEDAKHNFASSSVPKDVPLPPLPVPLSRSTSHNRTSRLPRRVLAASQIFQADENGNITPMIDQSLISTSNTSALLSPNDIDVSRGSIKPSATETAPTTPAKTTSPLPQEEGSSSFVIPEIHTPSRQRRATVSTRSPEPAERSSGVAGGILDSDMSPSKRKEKSRSHGNLFQRHIAPIAVLEAELMKPPPPPPTPRLSEVLDRNLFIAPPLISRENLLNMDDSIEHVREPSMDDLTSSPCHVEPYPPRVRASYDGPIPDTPGRHRIEGVYDRFLMATSGVKRLGKGYQSDNVGPVANTSQTVGLGAVQHKGRSFYSQRRPMPPPVSSEDLNNQRRAASVDELGMVACPDVPVAGAATKDEGNHTAVHLMRKAIKLIVPKNNTMSKRLSRFA